LEKLENSHDVELHWHSYQLRPKGSPPISPEYLARIEAGQPRLRAMAREQYGVELNQGPFFIDSRPALVGAKFAEAQGVGQAYHHAVMSAYWLNAQDIGDPQILAELAAGIGLDGQAYLAALEDGALDEQVQADIDQAQEYGLSGVPAIVLDNRYLIPGAQPYSVLTQATEQVQAELLKEAA